MIVKSHIYSKIEAGERLNFEELELLVSAIRNGEINPFRFVAILAMLETRNRIKGIDFDETADFIRALRFKNVQNFDNVVCTAGTGGDPIKTINVSTAASLVLAAGGVSVLKNGYKSVTGKCGSREILHSLGINPFQSLESVLNSVRKVGIGYFDFSKLIILEERSGFHSPLHYIGVLSHPVNLQYKVLGCSDENHFKIVEKIADRLFENYLISLNPEIDELSIVSPTLIIEKRYDHKCQYVLNPEDFNIHYDSYQGVKSLQTPHDNADFLLETLAGRTGPAFDLIALNAAAAFYLCNTTNEIGQGISLAKDILRSGSALDVIAKWREYSE